MILDLELITIGGGISNRIILLLKIKDLFYKIYNNYTYIDNLIKFPEIEYKMYNLVGGMKIMENYYNKCISN